ncbi:MAG: citramalate synthase [Alphaproteobacteria bacterium]
MTLDNRVYIYDSTLRDGAQTSSVNFTIQNKIAIAKKLDEIGIDYIEGGWPGANPTDDEFFANLPKTKKSEFVAFGMTRRNNSSAGNDNALNSLINSNTKSVCIVGKSWDFHLKHALNISEQENLAMIADSIKHIINRKKTAMFDAEHFFDGYKANPEFALNVVKTAYQAKARWIILCDTNGGTLPSEIKAIVQEVVKHIPGKNLGIHCHNDTGNGVANSIMAVEAGVRQVQGTINGLGERCGNANLTSIIPILTLKLNYDVGIKKDDLKNLTKLSNFLNDILNKEPDKYAPFVGKYAFAHKGGLHVSAVAKNAKSYEHIEPELVGNQRMILVSNQAGKSNIVSRLKSINLIKNDEDYNQKITDLVNIVKEQESKGYSYDSADASFEILAKKTLSIVPNYFELISFKVIDHRFIDKNNQIKIQSEAEISIKISSKTIKAKAQGNGPVNALDNALRKALLKNYPNIKNTKLIDYKVRILSPSDGTEAITRVQIESADDKNNKWNTIGVSNNIINASFLALHDSFTYYLSSFNIKN